MLDEEAADRWRALVNERKQESESLAATLTRIDSVDCAPFFTMKKGDGTVADEITKLFQRVVPDIYWYYYFSGLLCIGDEERVHPSTDSLRAAIVLDEAYIRRAQFFSPAIISIELCEPICPAQHRLYLLCKSACVPS
jgi:hypothetical protein